MTEPPPKRTAFSIEAILNREENDKSPIRLFPHIAPSPCFEYQIRRPLNNSTSPGYYHPYLESAKMQLHQRDLWTKFHQLGTEMIVTKSGRRMFPSLQVQILGLEPNAMYNLSIDFEPVDRKRYRYSFHQSNWVLQGEGDPELPPRIHPHPDSPSTGRHWLRHTISFDKVKLTNNQLDENGYIVLNSMHKYRPRVQLTLMSDVTLSKMSKGITTTAKCASDLVTMRSFTFPETEFMAVTAYQNQRITQLKIASNPFAKGFRETDTEDWLLTLLTNAQLASQMNWFNINPMGPYFTPNLETAQTLVSQSEARTTSETL